MLLGYRIYKAYDDYRHYVAAAAAAASPFVPCICHQLYCDTNWSLWDLNSLELSRSSPVDER